MSALLSEARKYKLGLILSHQYLAQVEDLRGAIYGNVGTAISFQLAAEDAEYVAREFAPVSVEELTGLDQHHIFLKLKVGGMTSHPFSAKTFPPPPIEISYRDQIVRWSRQYYARPRAVVERQAANHFLPRAQAPLARRAAGGRRVFPAKGARHPFGVAGRRPAALA